MNKVFGVVLTSKIEKKHTAPSNSSIKSFTYTHNSCICVKGFVSDSFFGYVFIRFGSHKKGVRLYIAERLIVGAARLERATACTPCKNASQLHHAPNNKIAVQIYTISGCGATILSRYFVYMDT